MPKQTFAARVVGPRIASMSDAEIVEMYNEILDGAKGGPQRTIFVL
jgi:hypothetical protein